MYSKPLIALQIYKKMRNRPSGQFLIFLFISMDYFMTLVTVLP